MRRGSGGWGCFDLGGERRRGIKPRWVCGGGGKGKYVWGFFFDFKNGQILKERRGGG